MATLVRNEVGVTIQGTSLVGQFSICPYLWGIQFYLVQICVMQHFKPFSSVNFVTGFVQNRYACFSPLAFSVPPDPAHDSEPGCTVLDCSDISK